MFDESDKHRFEAQLKTTQQLETENAGLREAIRQISIANTKFFTNGKTEADENNLLSAVMNAVAKARGF